MEDDNNAVGIVEQLIDLIKFIDGDFGQLFAALSVGASLMIFIYFRKDGPGYRIFATLLLVAGIAAIGYFLVWEPEPVPGGTNDSKNSARYAQEPLRVATEDCQGVKISSSVRVDVCVSGYVDSETVGNKNLGARGLVDNDLNRGVWLDHTPSGSYLPYVRIRFDEPSSLSRVDFMSGDQRSNKAFVDTALPRVLRYSSSSGRQGEFELANEDGTQTWLPDPPLEKETWVNFEVRSIYPGRIYDVFGVSYMRPFP
ncbi:MAG: hypothetical protein ABJQ34_03955 [Paracoccaceae bacterium]